MKKLLIFLLLLLLTFLTVIVSSAENEKNYEAEFVNLPSVDFTVEAASALLMEANTGEVLFSQNESKRASPASVTKIMTLLLIMEAIEDERISLEDIVSISEHASSMGGSQVFLKEGERISIEELLKCTVIASANDAAVALAEHLSGSEAAFVVMMNKRAKELGMNDTNFENASGLDDETSNHYTSAKDIAIMSRELIKHDTILSYSSLWQDTIRNGEFTLTNTNRLVRFYDGCNGLKTGSTDKAGYCISATAKRDNMQLIAVVMGAESRDERNNAARTLLDFGFSNYALYSVPERVVEGIDVYGGDKLTTSLYSKEFSKVVPKSLIKKVEMHFDIPDHLNAPIKTGETVGEIVYTIDDKKYGSSDIFIKEDIDKIGFLEIFWYILKFAFTK